MGQGALSMPVVQWWLSLNSSKMAPPGLNQPGLPQPNVAKRDAMILKYQQAGVVRPPGARTR